MTEANVYTAQVTDGREQPFFYSWNRRLRHLHGVSLRNLDTSLTGGRSRGKTITEDDYNVKTSAAILAQNERMSLHQSKSFDDLSKSGRLHKPKKAMTTHDQTHSDLKRPSKLRRRSTLHWGSSGPHQRQQKLEDVALNRLVDTWFSIHCTGTDDPVYISEVMERSMNPSFSYFDLDNTAPQITRSDEFEVKVWARNTQMDQYMLLVDLAVNLRSLQFVGKSLDNFHHPLPQNCILFHLEDGIYTSFTDMPAEEIVEPQLRPSQKSVSPANISSYDALMKLANLDDCIQDALQTREKLEREINALLSNKQENATSTEHLQVRREQADHTRQALVIQRTQIEKIKARKSELQQARAARKTAISESTQSLDRSITLPDTCRSTVDAVRGDINRTSELASGQIRRICEDLLCIYPIEPVKNRSLQFTIREIHLPNSVFDDTNRDQIAAALGYTGHLVHHLSLYLSMPLPYPIKPNGSGSFITDQISMSLAHRQFPLHPTNVNYKFEYGVFLLNKDIEFLVNRCGMRVVDVRHTLPNLKYLLYVLTAGTSELPARRAGGVRGLWAGGTSPGMSRRGSDDSVQSRNSIELPHGHHIASSKEKSADANDGFAAPSKVKGLPYRSSMLREVDH